MADLLGGKGANLAEMTRLGCRPAVPGPGGTSGGGAGRRCPAPRAATAG